jgi:hypothetical protein
MSLYIWLCFGSFLDTKQDFYGCPIQISVIPYGKYCSYDPGSSGNHRPALPFDDGRHHPQREVRMGGPDTRPGAPPKPICLPPAAQGAVVATGVDRLLDFALVMEL